MNKALTEVLSALKQLFSELEPQSDSLSFTIIISKPKQGINHLLQQSQLQLYPVKSLEHAALFYNSNAVVLRLEEEWLMQSNDLLTNSLRSIDRCFPPVEISAIVMGVAINELMDESPEQIEERITPHKQLWQWVQDSLPRSVPSHLIITQMDRIAGFCEFFHQDLRHEHNGILGFYFDPRTIHERDDQGLELSYRHLLQHLDQQVLNKLHPVRSTIKRTLIREFPLQMHSLVPALKRLLHQLKPQDSKLRAVYFTSSQQGGKSLDQLNSRIKHEYALCLPDYHYQAHNTQNYFIDGCLRDILSTTRIKLPRYRKIKRFLPYGITLLALVGLLLSSKHYWHRSQQLDTVSRELLKYEQITQTEQHSVNALYHLGQADTYMQDIGTGIFTPHSLSQLQNQLHLHTQNTLRQVLLPKLLQIAEQKITQPGLSTPEYFAALRTYIMLGDPTRFNEQQVLKWYTEQWHSHPDLSKELTLLKQSLRQPLQAARLNEQIINDARNALNALPDGYFYYRLAQQNFSRKNLDFPLTGFNIPQASIPFIYTQQGYLETVQKLDHIIPELKNSQWVTGRKFPDNIKSLIIEAYAYDYRNWWLNFLRQCQPQQVSSYREAQGLLQTLRENDSLIKLIDFAQKETGPLATDPGEVFNRAISKEFNQLHWLSQTALQNLRQQQTDLEKFVFNINLLQDQQENLFELTRQRFVNPDNSDPLSVFYQTSERYPSPLKEWTKQLADNIWFMLIRDSRIYIDQQWQQQVRPVYETTIANKYPFVLEAKEEVSITDFCDFFSPNGHLNKFTQRFIRPFLNTRKAQWTTKEINGYQLPISPQTVQQLIISNIVQSMFFKQHSQKILVNFTLEKINLDTMLKSLSLHIGNQSLYDKQQEDNRHPQTFIWPAENASLELEAIDGKKWTLEEKGVWAIFKLLEKVNIVPDEENPSGLQILFEINGNSGRYSLITQNSINPFTPGILRQIDLPLHIT